MEKINRRSENSYRKLEYSEENTDKLYLFDINEENQKIKDWRQERNNIDKLRKE